MIASVFSPPAVAGVPAFDMGRFARGVDGDDTAGFQACVSAAVDATVASGARVAINLRPGARYRLTSRVIGQGAIAGITFHGNGSVLTFDEDIGDGIPGLHFGYELDSGDSTWDSSLGVIASTTATADISRNSRTVLVGSTSGMAAGQRITIASSGEYFLGITGDSGFQPRSRSEMGVIRRVVSSTELELDHFPEDDYDVDAYTVTVKAHRTIGPIHFEGLTIVGAGQGGQHGGALWGPEGIRVEWAEDASFTRGEMRNFGSVPWRDFQCWGTRITGNRIVGRDVTDTSNAPYDNIWFYGPGSHGSVGVTFSGNTCLNLRRPQDVGPINDTTVVRHVVMSWNNVSGCGNGLGSHMAQHITAEGNEIADSGAGYFFRAKDVTIRGGRIRATGNNTSDAAIVLGSTPGGAYSESPDLGHIVIEGVHADIRKNFLVVKNSVSSLAVRGCTTRLAGSRFVWTLAKSIKNLSIIGNEHISTTRSGTTYIIRIESDTDNPMTVLDGAKIEGNTLGDCSVGIYIDGASTSAAPAKNITVRNNTFKLGETGNMQDSIRLGATGWYDGATICLGPNDHWAGSIEWRLDPAGSGGDMHRYTQIPVIDQTRNIVGRATSSGFASLSWGPGSGSTQKSTFRQGMRVLNDAIDAGEYAEWIITTAGTMGTITSGTTGSITSGSPTLTINANDDYRIFPGCYITVAGAGAASANLSARVTAISGTTITLDTNASTSVTNAAVSYTPPTIKGASLVQS